MFGASLPLAYLGARGLTLPAVSLPVGATPAIVVPELGLWGLYAALVAETVVPAVINYWRFHTGKWKRISEAYRPDAAVADD
jgi:Na+-driven multidrug efflux pump